MQLEDLFVKPEYRNKGVGKALFADLAKIAQQNVSFFICSFVLLADNGTPYYRTALAWIGPY